jgi:hypothetical protein
MGIPQTILINLINFGMRVTVPDLYYHQYADSFQLLSTYAPQSVCRKCLVSKSQYTFLDTVKITLHEAERRRISPDGVATARNFKGIQKEGYLNIKPGSKKDFTSFYVILTYDNILMYFNSSEVSNEK